MGSFSYNKYISFQVFRNFTTDKPNYKLMWKDNLEETKQRYLQWWNHKGIILNMWEHFQEEVTPHANVKAPPPPQNLSQKWFDPIWRAQYLDWYVAHSSFKADILPVANTQLGPGSLAAILGGIFESGEDTIWIHPNPNFTDDIVFDRQHPNWLLHKRLLTECKLKAQGNYFVGMPDLMEGLDVLAALKGTDQVLLDTVMQPEMLERQLQTINHIYFEVFDELYDIIREGKEMAFCYFSSWAPGKMTKLQSDISTMISVDDYRRFVQPFIREQCQRIDYTLYHLDGVGAIRHLPALLEIEELNAIQWTPGVGQPQGGSPKWYSLYRQILDAGKSVMACWVTLDELRPLLDNIGGEGVHLEMDFHNEQEVEKALRIVEEYQKNEDRKMKNEVSLRKTITLTNDDSLKKPPLKEIAQHRVLILDGGMGTMIQRYKLEEKDFRGKAFETHPKPLKGCNDLLSITRPEVIEDIHRKYLQAGANLIETNTFNAQRISMSDFGLENYCREINLASCRIARNLADEFSSVDMPRYVLGSVGPTNKICSMPTGDTPPLDQQLLMNAYLEQMDSLIEGGVDAILIETIFDTLNASIAIQTAQQAMQQWGHDIPLMLSFTVSTVDGHNMLGQSVPNFISSLDLSKIFSIGINCLSDIPPMIPLLKSLGKRFSTNISFYPNAGMPDAQGNYSKSPVQLQSDIWSLLDGHHLNILGGCCGTTNEYIQAFSQLVQPASGLFLSPRDLAKKRDDGNILVRNMNVENTFSNNISYKNISTTKHQPTTIFHAILQGLPDDASKATAAALTLGARPQDLIDHEMIRAMSELGRMFQNGKAFVPQLLMAGKAMKAALATLDTTHSDTKVSSMGKVLIGTVKGDLHDIGKNIVASMLEGCGFEVVNLGIDVSAEKFISEVKKHHPDILCMSALLTTTMGYMEEVINALKEAGIRHQVKVMVGGAPVTQRFADEIGADGYSDNANSAVEVAKELMKSVKP